LFGDYVEAHDSRTQQESNNILMSHV
jgi:hypothetical protein